MHGGLSVTPQLQEHHAQYLRRFYLTRRVKRDYEALARENRKDPLRLAVGLPLGVHGGYYLGEADDCWMSDTTVIDGASPPRGQPSGDCAWSPSVDGGWLIARPEERYPEHRILWLRYLIKHFLCRWGYTVAGSVGWEGPWVPGGPFCRLIRVVGNHARCKVVGRGQIRTLPAPPPSAVASIR